MFSGSIGPISAELYDISSVGRIIKKRYLIQCRRHPGEDLSRTQEIKYVFLNWELLLSLCVSATPYNPPMFYPNMLHLLLGRFISLNGLSFHI